MNRQKERKLSRIFTGKLACADPDYNGTVFSISAPFGCNSADAFQLFADTLNKNRSEGIEIGFWLTKTIEDLNKQGYFLCRSVRGGQADVQICLEDGTAKVLRNANTCTDMILHVYHRASAPTDDYIKIKCESEINSADLECIVAACDAYMAVEGGRYNWLYRLCNELQEAAYVETAEVCDKPIDKSKTVFLDLDWHIGEKRPVFHFDPNGALINFILTSPSEPPKVLNFQCADTITEPMTAIKHAMEEYLSDIGKNVKECTWCDAVLAVPQEQWRRHGLIPVSIETQTIAINSENLITTPSSDEQIETKRKGRSL